MQTFLPYESFAMSAKALDYRRLGKQRVEAMQILDALKRRKGGWVNHPAVRMWRGYEDALKQYQRAMILEWMIRGYVNNMAIPAYVPKRNILLPWWLGEPLLHSSHRANLRRKDPDWYRDFTEDPKTPYYWPV
jgi:hypothetical protein